MAEAMIRVYPCILAEWMLQCSKCSQRPCQLSGFQNQRDITLNGNCALSGSVLLNL
ncbi:MAG: hypothetical protein JWR68_1958 [Polaromonas sp.]|nr:hypothetical protein [Polaromonas sp.]